MESCNGKDLQDILHWKLLEILAVYLSFSQCFGNRCPTNTNECGIHKYDKVEPTECFLKHKDGHIVPVIKNARVMREKDNGSFIAIVETVTDLTKLENAKRKYEDASRKMGEFYQFGNIIAKRSRYAEGLFRYSSGFSK